MDDINAVLMNRHSRRAEASRKRHQVAMRAKQAREREARRVARERRDGVTTIDESATVKRTDVDAFLGGKPFPGVVSVHYGLATDPANRVWTGALSFTGTQHDVADI